MEVPQDFDWITARAKCSLAQVFTELAEKVQSDVQTIRALRGEDEQFRFERQSDYKFLISRIRNVRDIPDLVGTIVFERVNAEIKVREDVLKGKDLFSAVPSLSADGHCQLYIDGQGEPFEVWQVSRKALEKLFFGQS